MWPPTLSSRGPGLLRLGMTEAFPGNRMSPSTPSASVAAPPYVLFYSKFCSASRRVQEDLQRSPLQRRVIAICVDDKKHALPPSITSVPSLMVRATHQVLTGSQLLSFLAQQRPEAPPRGAGAPLAGPGPAAGFSPAYADQADLHAFQPMEMSGYSDRYAFLDDERNVGMPLQFERLDQEASFAHMAGGSSRGRRGESVHSPDRPAMSSKNDNGNIESAYEAMLAARKLDIAGPVQRS